MPSSVLCNQSALNSSPIHSSISKFTTKQTAAKPCLFILQAQANQNTMAAHIINHNPSQFHTYNPKHPCFNTTNTISFLLSVSNNQSPCLRRVTCAAPPFISAHGHQLRRRRCSLSPSIKPPASPIAAVIPETTGLSSKLHRRSSPAPASPLCSARAHPVLCPIMPSCFH
ncbi:hypothetical protein M0R45_027976 [Rubus argutus]|uniref:Uncharacterized protein n=1 Tax=Rubus argutus TaxID=59490 RepID=A0AAW1W383_RUBAR